ncbi:30S ribosomal protein S12 methylthiotransferase RimO [Pontibacter sp. BT310]|uniref:Ribosomal protein uS12 methylthiotransferase RimO n=1 Tax=Pontibacter populi TaxID=890055 RepID=A0ABS6X8H9_9BACT|nr:30S ribosomal protein S12 methylthiotransferase RimO [Pontibacter populi]MBJ6117430.1 30S ribosomal protein S12 methylthiotransferase RimO [Pontibacter sp. BT310]MBR0569855.1 30S ribosomal protein S12 methylthiotransferase RimO [Microvirga sp. STS03]MBW3364283.1 30S ribosomal protein S12 methylthiotransferase RimO [Pontibacter populi]
MKVRSLKKDKVNVITLGCSKNLVDSEVLMGQLRANEFDVAHESDKDDSNIIIVNTCGFIDNAKQESIDTILRYADAKEAGQIDKLYVTGCLSQRYKDSLEAEIPQVDAYFGTLELPRLLKTLEADYKHELIGERLLTTPSHYAYFKIAEGCNRPCSFCAIPLMRGKHVDRPIEDLVKEAKRLAGMGTKELILIAQDLTYYGLQQYGERKLADLLRNLSDVEGIEWIRMQYAYPSQFPMEVFDVMAERDNICKYLDMPLQHISDNMLKTMRRGISKRRTIELVDSIRQRVPDIALRTTLIAGHPGETDQDFQELYDWVEETRFDRLGIFAYSHEDNTHSYTLEDNVPEEVKQERADAIMELQQGISVELNEEKVGKTYKVLFDRKESGYFVGRTQYDSPEVDNEVLVPADSNYVRLGDFANVKITDSSDFDLYGEVVA